MPTVPRKNKGVYLELEPDLVEQVKALAERNLRGWTDEVRHALRRHLADPPTVVMTTPPLSPAEAEPTPTRKRGRPKK